MKNYRRNIFSITSLFLLLLFSFVFAQTQQQRSAVLLELKDAIGPATQDYVHQGLKEAKQQAAEIVILQIDTPGGLDKSMRGIISDIIASPIPVVAFVAPSGARAASAGTYILFASHIAAMAPGTNLGAATPVNLGMAQTPAEDKKQEKSLLEKKASNDAMAYIRSLAQLRGRNVQWAEQAVSKGASLSAEEALKSHVIDVIADNVPDLLSKLNGHTVTVQGKTQTLNTIGISVVTIGPNWRTKFLAIITDPNVAYLLLIIGMWGLFFEFVNPGFMLPGVMGAICLLLALYAFQLLPINYAGLGLLTLGVAFMVTEIFISSFGALGVGGLIAFLIGSVMLLDNVAPGFKIAWPLILAVTVVTGLFFMVLMNLALKSRFRPVVSGREEMIGSTGKILMNEDGAMRVRIRGELWQVRSPMPLIEGQKVKVIALEGLVLLVEPVNTKKI